MKRRKKLQPGFLEAPLDSTVLVVCPNYDGFHSCVHFARYIIFGKGTILDEPTFAECKIVLDHFPDLPVKIIYGPCIHCQAKGVRGPVGINLPPTFPPDPFEQDEPYDDGYPKEDPDGSDDGE